MIDDIPLEEIYDCVVVLLKVQLKFIIFQYWEIYVNYTKIDGDLTEGLTRMESKTILSFRSLEF